MPSLSFSKGVFAWGHCTGPCISSFVSPTALGNYEATIFATNAAGAGQGTIVFTIINGPLPEITSRSTAAACPGVPFTYQITATEQPISFGTVGLPDWLTLDTTSGRISGTPPLIRGTFAVTVIATNQYGSTAAPLTIGAQTVVQWGDGYDFDIAPAGTSNLVALSAALGANLALKANGRS